MIEVASIKKGDVVEIDVLQCYVNFGFVSLKGAPVQQLKVRRISAQFVIFEGANGPCTKRKGKGRAFIEGKIINEM